MLSARCVSAKFRRLKRVPSGTSEAVPGCSVSPNNPGPPFAVLSTCREALWRLSQVALPRLATRDHVSKAQTSAERHFRGCPGLLTVTEQRGPALESLAGMLRGTVGSLPVNFETALRLSTFLIFNTHGRSWRYALLPRSILEPVQGCSALLNNRGHPFAGSRACREALCRLSQVAPRHPTTRDRHSQSCQHAERHYGQYGACPRLLCLA